METTGTPTDPPQAASAGDTLEQPNGHSATITELSQFLEQSRNRNPDEVLGAIAQAGLLQSTSLAALVVAAILVVFTIGPYTWSSLAPDQPSRAPAQTAANQSRPADSSAAAEPEPAEDPVGTTTPATVDPSLDALGIGEAKTADPKKNPLEDSLDNLLDKLD